MIGQFCHVTFVYCTLYAGRLQHRTLMGSMDMVRVRVRVRDRFPDLGPMHHGKFLLHSLVASSLTGLQQCSTA